MKSLKNYSEEIYKFLRENAAEAAPTETDITWEELAARIEEFKQELTAAGFESINDFLLAIQQDEETEKDA